MSSTTRAITAMLALLALGAGCSSSTHTTGATGSATTIAGGSTSAGNGGTGNGAGGNGAGAGGTGTGATTRSSLPGPTTSAPSTPRWLKAHAADLAALKTATQDVNAAFQANDDAAKKAALIECANAAAPLAQSASGSLPKTQADAIATISDGCAAMAHDLKSGDTSAVATGKSAFDAALVIVTPLFP